MGRDLIKASLIFLFIFLISLGNLGAKSNLRCLEEFARFVAIKDYSYGEKEYRTLTQFTDLLQKGQFEFGQKAAKHRYQKLKKMKPKERQKFMNERVFYYVIGPKGFHWIHDRHHTSKALIKIRKNSTNEKDKKLQLTFQEIIFDDLDTSKLSMKEFEEEMLKRKLIFPFVNGEFKSIKNLGPGLDGMTHNYYRDLAWILRKAGIFERTSVPFAEFYWGVYLSKFIQNKDDYSKKTIKYAMKVALIETEESVNLPGFRKIENEDRAKIIKKALKKLKKKKLIVQK